jgi:hypothetical protein
MKRIGRRILQKKETLVAGASAALSLEKAMERPALSHLSRVLLSTVVPLLSAASVQAAGAMETLSDGRPAKQLAAKHPNGQGIAKVSEVIFADDFEAWEAEGRKPPANTWNVRTNKTSRTRVIPGRIDVDGSPGPGDTVLKIACWTEGSGSQAGGLSLKLGNYNHRNEGLGEGYDDLYVRYYLKFDEGYRAVRNHGANLGGRDLTRHDAAWVGMAGIRDVSARGYFYSGVQPRGDLGSRQLEIGFYSYHLDKRGPWGENYDVQRRIPVEVGSWHCVERHMKLNSVDPTQTDPANPDGLEELWIDGQPTIRKQGVRFRRVPQLRITFFSLETYYHGLPKQYGRQDPIRVYVDNVVIARQYVGPVGRPER